MSVPQNTVVIHGPPGCGKTVHQDELAKRFGCTAIVDCWRDRDHRQPLTPGALHLTYNMPNPIKDVLIVDYLTTGLPDLRGKIRESGSHFECDKIAQDALITPSAVEPDEVLVKQVARAIAQGNGEFPDELVGTDPVWKFYKPDAIAAIATLVPSIRAQVFEDAANIADQSARDCNEDTPGGFCAGNQARHIAAAIRSLKAEAGQ